MTSRATVLGTGLIGTSLGIALGAAGWDVWGWDPDPSALSVAGAMGSVEPAPDPDSATEGSELIVLAGPTGAIIDTIRTLRTTALVTDVAGIKVPVVREAEGRMRFVGGHPMAGRETSGPAGASGTLFRGATWILTEDHARRADVELMRKIVNSLGAVPVVMTAADHDRAVAAVSHLPQVVASALMEVAAAEPLGFDLAAGGFRDLTRVASSSPEWWSDVLVGNRDSVAPSLRALAADLVAWADLVESGDAGGVEGRLRHARALRTRLAAPVGQIGVVLEDRPGEIAQVGAALASSGVDLRDLQLRHATHGGGGVLTLSVRTEEIPALRRAIGQAGFRVLDPEL